MQFDPYLAAVRFGTGISLRRPPPDSVAALMEEITGPDEMAERFPIPGFHDAQPSHATLIWAFRSMRNAIDTPFEDAARQGRDMLRKQVIPARRRMHLAKMGRAIDARFGLRERLTSFWADHFTVMRRSADTAHLIQPYIEDAIRPHVAGSFPEMVKAVAKHPMMLLYLDQVRSTGPDSQLGLSGNRGLNENLARELLELHLLGVGGGYSQTDVRQLAELLTGLTYQPARGFFFDARRAEPGAEEVMGLQFGTEGTLENVLDALEALALHPQTAAHLARKLAVHFVAPDPDAELVEATAAAYLDSGGDLARVMQAMLDHPASWAPEKLKVRLPEEFIVASLRALRVNGRQFSNTGARPYQVLIERPLRIMGQPLLQPGGPDGWSEDPTDWIIPQAMAGRITWALRAPVRVVDELPDPRRFITHAFGPNPPEAVRFAAAAAEKPQDAIGVILASAAFQRR